MEELFQVLAETHVELKLLEFEEAVDVGEVVLED